MLNSTRFILPCLVWTALAAACSSPTTNGLANGGASGTANAGAGSGGSSNGGSGGSASPSAGAAGEAASGLFELNGVIADGQAAKDADVALIWIVGDNAYKSTQVRAVDGAFHFSLGTPPDAALVQGFGMAFLLAIPAGTTVPDGLITSSSVFGGADHQVSSAQVVIYRASAAANAFPNLSWPTAFPVGYACGSCMSADGSFDSWVPGACGTLTLKVIKTADQCNWT